MAKSSGFVLVAVLVVAVAGDAAAQNAPETPRVSVDVPQLTTDGRTVRVAAGGDLQKALDDARPGDRIELQPETGRGWRGFSNAAHSLGKPRCPDDSRH